MSHSSTGFFSRNLQAKLIFIAASVMAGLTALAAESQPDLFPTSKNEIVCNGDTYVSEENFEFESGPGCNAYDAVTGNICFRGDVKWAVWALGQEIMWGDEEWLENPKRVDDDTLTVEVVDGPNELRDEVLVSRCR